MAHEDPHLDYVDYTSISFPSDGLTVATLRKRYPHRFDVDGFPLDEFFKANIGTVEGDAKESWFADMLSAERYLARHSFEKALGRKYTCLTELGDTRDYSAKALGERYIYFGLASGAHHADQLIRAFEAQAAAQAKPPQGRSSLPGG